MHIRREEAKAIEAQALLVPEEEEGAERRRRTPRHGVLWAAQVVFGQAVLDCIVLDISLGGARVRFGAAVTLPSHVALRLRDGTVYEAVPRWFRGTMVGLEFLGAGTALPDAHGVARRARAALRAVRASDPTGWLTLLQADRFFGDEALRQAAEAAERAHHRLQAALQAHAATPED